MERDNSGQHPRTERAHALADGDAHALHGDAGAYSHPRISGAGYAYRWDTRRGAYNVVIERPRVRVRDLMRAPDPYLRMSHGNNAATAPSGRRHISVVRDGARQSKRVTTYVGVGAVARIVVARAGFAGSSASRTHALPTPRNTCARHPLGAQGHPCGVA